MDELELYTSRYIWEIPVQLLNLSDAFDNCQVFVQIQILSLQSLIHWFEQLIVKPLSKSWVLSL